ncbi:hypothetical protein EVAR_68438_1 [Eumeta japonica]|uniref:Uncharacterized protein n=1 Tax=Eumeta variegata TaxID=151549 RepID=A0A4C1ZV53_EUMVA|nr:hypothetical protein EVAR_68438_1 [Eumeta japonica]
MRGQGFGNKASRLARAVTERDPEALPEHTAIGRQIPGSVTRKRYVWQHCLPWFMWGFLELRQARASGAPGRDALSLGNLSLKGDKLFTNVNKFDARRGGLFVFGAGTAARGATADAGRYTRRPGRRGGAGGALHMYARSYIRSIGIVPKKESKVVPGLELRIGLGSEEETRIRTDRRNETCAVALHILASSLTALIKMTSLALTRNSDTPIKSNILHDYPLPHDSEAGLGDESHAMCGTAARVPARRRMRER